MKYFGDGECVNLGGGLKLLHIAYEFKSVNCSSNAKDWCFDKEFWFASCNVRI
jgi:hypothetical protein